MKIEIKVHQGYGKLKHVETIEVDCLFNLSTILESYPAHEVHDISFFDWGIINVYLRRKTLTRLQESERKYTKKAVEYERAK